MRVSTVDPVKKARAKELLTKALQSVKMKVIAEGSGVPYATIANFVGVNSIGEEKLEALLIWLEAYFSGEGPVEIPKKEEIRVEAVQAPVPTQAASEPVKQEIQVPDPNEPDKDYANEIGGIFSGNEWLEYGNALSQVLNTVIKGYGANKDLPGYPRKEVEGYLRAKADYEAYQKKIMQKKGLTK